MSLFHPRQFQLIKISPHIEIIQIRVYDESGEFVESFDVDEIILGNTISEILPENLPIPLQEMLIQ